MLMLIAHTPDHELTATQLDVSMCGAGVVGGYCADSEVLRLAEEMPLRGLILSSLNPDLVPVAIKLKVPVIVIEGFGKITYSSAVFKILTSSEKRDACLKASANSPYSGDRPEIILPLPAEGEEPAATTEFKPGQMVRVQGLTQQAQIGTIFQIRPGRSRLLSGLSAPAADVRLENNDLVTIPLANLDVLE
jgi:hypothetical protein